MINSNKLLKARNNFLLDEIQYLNETFEVRFFEAIDAIRKEYYTFLNPKPERISISKTEQYDIRLMNILWIESDGRLKKIYLKRKIANTEGKHLTDRITINDDNVTYKTLLPLLDKLGNHLVQVHRTYAVNVAYFTLEHKILDLKLKTEISHIKPSIKISKSFIGQYKTIKERFCYFRSFHKKLSHSN